jgi:hypothetical protein
MLREAQNGPAECVLLVPRSTNRFGPAAVVALYEEALGWWLSQIAIDTLDWRVPNLSLQDTVLPRENGVAAGSVTTSSLFHVSRGG